MNQARRFRVVAIVEGHGEQFAVPVLLRRWFRFRRFANFETPDLAVRAPGSGAFMAPYDRARQRGIEYFVELALRHEPDAILIVRDADDECLERRAVERERLGPELVRRSLTVIEGLRIPVGVVIANREYEAWFLAGCSALRKAGAFPSSARLPRDFDPESPRDCKGRVSNLLGRPYSETADQPILTDSLPFRTAIANRSPSFGKLLRELQRLTQAARARRRAGS